MRMVLLLGVLYIRIGASTSTSTSTSTKFTATASPTGKLICKGGDGATFPLTLLNNHTEDSVSVEGDIALWCDGLMHNVFNGYSQQFTERQDGNSLSTNNMSLALLDCSSEPKISYDECLDWWGEIANGCDTSTANKHGGTYQYGCVLFDMAIDYV